MPKYNLTPDAIEPIVIGESAKHRPTFRTAWAKNDARPQVIALQGGRVRNAIPGFAEATVAGLCRADAEAIAQSCAQQTEVDFVLTDTDAGLHIQANGRGTHIGTAHLGRNGQTALVALLTQLPLADCPSTQVLHKLAKLFPHGVMDGTSLGLTVRDELMGTSSTNFTVCRMDETSIECKLDSRGPTNATWENYAAVILRALEQAGFTVENTAMDDAHYVQESEPLVQLIKRAYQDVTGRSAACAFSVGASYAHYVDGAVSTGVAAPGIDTMLHKCDEFLPLEDFFHMVELYTLLTLQLCSEEGA